LDSFPEVHVDGIEIDGDVVEVGKKYFDNAHPNITPMVMDGRIYLQSVDKKYDLIQIDAYRQPYIPFHLVTQEFFQEVHDHLEDDGVLAINVASVRGVSQDLVAMIFRTIREVFPWAVVVRATRSNDVIVATKQPELLGKNIDTMRHAKESPRVRQALSRVDALEGLAMDTTKNRYAARISTGIEGWQDAQLLTDDFAPVEMAWDLMTLEFAK
jgi:spermidine synthase